jgi:hypothetical protein
VTRPRAADDFAAIRERIEELRRERARVWANASDAAEQHRYAAGHKPSPVDKPTIRRASFRDRRSPASRPPNHRGRDRYSCAMTDCARGPQLGRPSAFCGLLTGA